MLHAAALMLLAQLTLPQPVADPFSPTGPIFSSPARSGAHFAVTESINFFAGGGLLGMQPPNDSSLVFTAEPNLDGGNTWEAYDDGGVAMSTTQGSGEVFGSILGQRALLDITDSSHPFTTDARIRAMFLTDWTCIGAGYATTRGNATTQILLDQYDGTHEITIYSQGSAVRVSNDGTAHFANSDTAYGQPIDGISIWWGRQQGNTLCAGMMDIASEDGCITHAPPVAMTSGHLDYGAFPAPFTGNAMRGNLFWVKCFAQAQSDQWLSDAIWNFRGITQPRAMLANSMTHDVPQLEGMFDPTTGQIALVHSFGVFNSSTAGVATQHAYTNYTGVTPYDISSLQALGGAQVDANLIAGALGTWKNTTPTGRVWNTTGNAGVGIDAGSVPTLDGGAAVSTHVNCSFIGQRGDAGTNISGARIQFSGLWAAFDGGNVDSDAGCQVAGLTDTPAYGPSSLGCTTYFVNPSVIQCSIYVGGGGTTGSAFVSQAQLTTSRDVCPPTVDNGSKGFGYLALDGGILASGATKGGGIEVVAQYPFDFPNVTSTSPAGLSGFLEDAYSSAAPNHIITHTYGSQPAGLQMLGIVYGPSFTTENYLLTTFSLPAKTWFAVKVLWEANRTKCRARSFINICADQSVAGAQACHATTQVNVGTWGECPIQADTTNLGDRFDNSDNQHVQFATVTFYKQL